MPGLPLYNPAVPPEHAIDALPQPYLLFLGDIAEPAYAKTAFGLRDWARDRCVGEFGCDGVRVSTGLPWLTPAQAVEAGARAMAIGVANPGGHIPLAWVPALMQALESGLDLVGGMHSRLADIAPLRTRALALGRRLFDVRQPPADLQVASGHKRTGKRLLTVGTDCALGKKYTALTLVNEFRRRGIDADFRATGQTGILIAGQGMPIDAAISDFAAGAAERLSPDADPRHWDVIEGQGALSHPAYGGVSLSLLHGSQPDVFVVCHAHGREHMLGHPGYAVCSIEDTIELTLRLGRRTNPSIRCAGVSLNTANLSPDDADRVLAAEAERLGCPVADPMRGGAPLVRLVAECLA